MVDELEEEAADPEIPEMGQSASNLSLLSARQAYKIKLMAFGATKIFVMLYYVRYVFTIR